MRYKENIVQRCIQRTNTNQVSILYRETKKVLNNPENTQGIMTLYLWLLTLKVLRDTWFKMILMYKNW